MVTTTISRSRRNQHTVRLQHHFTNSIITNNTSNKNSPERQPILRSFLKGSSFVFLKMKMKLLKTRLLLQRVFYNLFIICRLSKRRSISCMLAFGMPLILYLLSIFFFNHIPSTAEYLSRITSCSKTNPYKYLFNRLPSERCDNMESGSIILCLLSPPDHLQERDVVRRLVDSWEHPVTLIFFVGRSDRSLREHGGLPHILSVEFQHFDDVVQTTFVDGKEKMNLKRISVLKWVAEFCHQDDAFVVVTSSSRVLKGDFDLRIAILKSEMEEAASQRAHFVAGPSFDSPRIKENNGESSDYCYASPVLSKYDWSIDSEDVHSFRAETASILYEASQRDLRAASPKCDVVALSATLVGIPHIRMFGFWPMMKLGEKPPTFNTNSGFLARFFNSWRRK